MPCYCAAYNCREKSAKGGPSFHCFPRDPLMIKKWLFAIRRKGFIPTKNSKLCSKHFTPDSFNTSPWSSLRVLKPDAVPSVFDFPDMPSDKPREFPEWLNKSVSSSTPVTGDTPEESPDPMEKSVKIENLFRSLPIPVSGAQDTADSSKDTDIHPILELVELPVLITSEGQVPDVKQKTSAPVETRAVFPRVVAGQFIPESLSASLPLEVVVCEYNAPKSLPDIHSIPPHHLLGRSSANAQVSKNPSQSFQKGVDLKSLSVQSIAVSSSGNALAVGDESAPKVLGSSVGGKPIEEPPLGAALEVAKVEEVKGDEIVNEYELTVTEESLMRLHGLSFTLPVPCDLCPLGTVFDDLNEFDAHMADHLEAKMFACQLCSNTYRSWSNLVAHRKMFHSGKVLSCEHCGSNKTHKRLEGAVHFPIGDKPHGCEECLVGLESVKEVYQHYVRHKAPPCGNRRRHRKRNRRGVKAKSGDNNPSEIVVKSTSLTVNDDVMKSGNVGAANPSAAANGLRPQNESSTGIELVNPGESSMENLPGILGEKEVMKPAVIAGGCFVRNLNEDKGMNVSVKRSGDDLVVCPVSLPNIDSSFNLPGPSSVGLNVEVAGVGTGVVTENATALKDLNSQVNSTISQDNVSTADDHPSNESENVGLNPPEILSERLSPLTAEESNPLLVEEPKKCPEKKAQKRKTKGKEGEEKMPKSHKKGTASTQGIKPWRIRKPAEGPQHFCPHCPYSGKKLQEYRIHLIGCSENSDCVMCSSNHLKRSVTKDHEYCQPKIDKFPCVPCGTLFESGTEFTTHWNEHHAEVDLPCCLCGRKFNTSEYTDHIRSCEQRFIEWDSTVQPRSLTCDECGKTFVNMEQIRRHLRRHERNRNVSLYCNVCNRLFQHKGAYSKHLWANPTHGPAEHRARFPGTCTEYMCERCGKTFGRRGALNKHLRSHDGLKPYKCSNCQKAFTTGSALIIHNRQHTGERPYMCDICGKSFSQQGYLLIHTRRHQQEGGIRARKPRSDRKPKTNPNKAKRFTCPYCSRVLSSKQVFEGHVRHHTGERPYVCDICDRGFTLEKIMKNHRKGHEREMTELKLQLSKEVPEERKQRNVEDKGMDNVEEGFRAHQSGNFIYFCSKCGLGVMSPYELEDHLAKGDCFSDDSEMYCITVG